MEDAADRQYALITRMDDIQQGALCGVESGSIRDVATAWDDDRPELQTMSVPIIVPAP
jgi:hypothetical protein